MDAKKHAVFVEPVNHYGLNKDVYFQLTFYLFVTFSKFRHFNIKSCCAKAKIKLHLLQRFPLHFRMQRHHQQTNLRTEKRTLW